MAEFSEIIENASKRPCGTEAARYIANTARLSAVAAPAGS
jgi:hypothetical protein